EVAKRTLDQGRIDVAQNAAPTDHVEGPDCPVKPELAAAGECRRRTVIAGTGGVDAGARLRNDLVHRQRRRLTLRMHGHFAPSALLAKIFAGLPMVIWSMSASETPSSRSLGKTFSWMNPHFHSRKDC